MDNILGLNYMEFHPPISFLSSITLKGKQSYTEVHQNMSSSVLLNFSWNRRP